MLYCELWSLALKCPSLLHLIFFGLNHSCDICITLSFSICLVAIVHLFIFSLAVSFGFYLCLFYMTYNWALLIDELSPLMYIDMSDVLGFNYVTLFYI